MATDDKQGLIRGISLGSATLLNTIDMIGVGPFITIPLMIGSMHGPQAMLGWILGAIFAVFDGLVWAELGAAMPGAGGSYWYLKEIYGPKKLGRLISFLFIFQLSFSAPLSVASGAIGPQTTPLISGQGCSELLQPTLPVWTFPSLGHLRHDFW